MYVEFILAESGGNFMKKNGENYSNHNLLE